MDVLDDKDVVIENVWMSLYRLKQVLQATWLEAFLDLAELIKIDLYKEKMKEF